ncbi:MAG: hypothetical protein ACYTG5_06130 [Planctomycetota bacterium]|jgi:hypothetical protein
MNALLSKACASTVLICLGLSAQDQGIIKKPITGDSARELHTYDIRDLLERLMDYGDLEELGVDARQARLESISETLEDTLQNFVRPTLVKNEDLKIVGNSHLVVTARPEQQVWIARYLQRQAEQKPALLNIRARVISADEQEFARLDVGDQPKILHEGEELERFLETLTAGKSDVMIAPVVTVYNQQSFSISTTKPITYVKDFKVDMVDGALLADPVLETVNQGVILEGQAASLGDDMVGISCKLTLREVSEADRTVEIEIAGTNQTGTIGLPRIETLEIDTTIALSMGTAAVFPGPLSDGRYPLIMISADLYEQLPTGSKKEKR